MRRRPLLPVLVAFVVTRTLLLLVVLHVVAFPGPDVTTDVSVIYQGWYDVLRTGTFPIDDVSWQYPPAAALAVTAPALLPFLGYTTAFFCLAAAADVVTFALLIRAGHRVGHRVGHRAGRHDTVGSWIWVVGLVAVGPTAYARYDVLVTALAVAALLAEVGRPRTAGLLLGLGALLKAWPILLLAGVRSRVMWAWAAASTVLLGLAAFALPGPYTFLGNQQHRGVEIESLGATAIHLARLSGFWHGTVVHRYGALEFVGSGVEMLGHVMLGLTIIAFCWLLLWRLRARPLPVAAIADAAFVAVLLFTLTSRVLSPQYVIWLVGLAAACTSLRSTARGLPAWLVVAAAALTAVIFPANFEHVVDSSAFGVALLVSRNGLLVVATAVACRRLWTAYVTGRPGTEPLATTDDDRHRVHSMVTDGSTRPERR